MVKHLIYGGEEIFGDPFKWAVLLYFVWLRTYLQHAKNGSFCSLGRGSFTSFFITPKMNTLGGQNWGKSLAEGPFWLPVCFWKIEHSVGLVGMWLEGGFGGEWVGVSPQCGQNSAKWTWFLFHKVGPDSDILFWEGKKIPDHLFLFTLIW